MFIDKKKTSTYLGNEIKKIKAGEVFVIDVATISSFEEQAFVVGDVMKSIDEMYSARYYNLKSWIKFLHKNCGIEPSVFVVKYS